MKKLYSTLLLSIGTVLFAVAQPILTAADFSNFSVNFRIVEIVPETTVSAGGPNQTWDYSTLVAKPDILGYSTTVPVSAAPFHSSFPTANYCIKASIPIGAVVYETFGLSRLTSSGLESLGTTSSTGITKQYIDTEFMPLPLTYNTTYIDVRQRTTDAEPRTSTETYDAYGTLITPNGTFTNVIRMKSVSGNYTGYNWIKVSPYSLLLSIDVENATGNVTSIALFGNTSLGTNQVSIDNGISLYPNPVTNFLNIDSINPIDQITITDMLGKTVFETNENNTKINLSFLKTGLYIAKIKTDQGQKTMKISKL